MKVDIFDFELDKDLIASQPAEPRDSCRLLDLSVEGEISDRIFTELMGENPELRRKFIEENTGLVEELDV